MLGVPLGLTPDGAVELLGLAPAGVLGRAPGIFELTPVGSLGFTNAGFRVLGLACDCGTVLGAVAPVLDD